MKVISSCGPGGCGGRAGRRANRDRRATQRGKSTSGSLVRGSRSNTGSTKKVLNAGQTISFGSAPKQTGKERREERRENRRKADRASQQRYSNPRYL